MNLGKAFIVGVVDGLVMGILMVIANSTGMTPGFFAANFGNYVNRRGFGFAHYLRSDCRSIIYDRAS